MTEPITVKFGDIGWAEAYPFQYETYQEAYRVNVFSSNITNHKHDYDIIMKTIHWGMQQGFTVLSVNGDRLESVMPELSLREGKEGNCVVIKQFTFAKDFVKTLGEYKE